jgi:hypothetical protein
MAELHTCPECNGTGAYEPDCWCCDGEMIIPIAKALENGFSEEDLEDAYDGHCRCPSDECQGDPCDLCGGDGRVAHQTIEDEITRTLLCAKHGHIPARRRRLHYDRVAFDDALLARFAGCECKDRGWITWYRSIFGDEISLTASGEAEAEKRAVGWARGADVSLCWIDDDGRFADDGGNARADHG